MRSSLNPQMDTCHIIHQETTHYFIFINLWAYQIYTSKYINYLMCDI